MPVARFLFVGDIHYEGIESYFPNNHLSLISSTLKQIWQYARENGVENVVIGGDIFENPFPKDESKKAFLKTLDKRLNYYIILGNHDYANPQENSLNLCKYFIEDLGLMDNVKFFIQPETIEIDGVPFDMLPFPFTKPLTKENSICIGHFQVKGYLGDNGRKFNDGPVLDDKHIWLLGHLHRQQDRLYPGSVVQTKFGEPVNKYFFDCKSNGKELKLKKVSIDTPFKLIDLVVQKLEDLDYLKPENCYRLYVPKHLDSLEIQKRTKDFNIWQVKGLDSGKNIEQQKIDDVDVSYMKANLSNEIDFLKMWLQDPSNCKLNENQIEEAVKIVEDLQGDLNDGNG